MPFESDEEFWDALDRGYESALKYKGPIIDLTHLAEEPAPENDDTNEICSEPEPAAAQSPA
jgi:hypothetical protein